MMRHKIIKIYFSPTGNTKKSVDAMAASVGTEFLEFDMTVEAEINPCVFSSGDFAIIGAPVYGGRIPKAAADRLSRFKGSQTPCIVLVTYGNRHYDDALLELADMAEAQGFAVKGAAALVGRHTFGQIQSDRPDSNDLDADKEFARRAFENKNARNIRISGNRPYKAGGNGGSFRPLTSDACISCGLCANNCPVHAIGPDCRTIGDRCISCFRCIRNCPPGAKHMNVVSYLAFAADFSDKLKIRRENEYFL
jgi:ferredoxin